MGVGEDNAIVWIIDLIDRTDKAAATAFLNLQKMTLLNSQGQLTAEQELQMARTRDQAIQMESLRTQRQLTKELLIQKEITAGLRDVGGTPIGTVRRVNSFEDLKTSFLSYEGMKGRFLYLMAGQIGTMMAFSAVIGGAAALVRTLVGSQMELQESTAKLSIVLDASAQGQQRDLQMLVGSAREWALAHGQAAAEVVSAMYDLGAAGLKAVQILQAMPAVALLSQGGLLTLADSSELVTMSLQTFAKEALTAVDIADMIQATAANTQVTVTDLAVAIKYVAGTAVTAGMTFQDLNSLLGAMGTLGLRGSTAGTSLNQALTQMIKKQGEIRQLGIEVTDTAGNMRRITDIIADFQKVFGTKLSGGELKVLTDLFDIRGARAMERLISDTTVLKRVMGDLAESEGEVFRAAEQGSNTLSEAWKVFKNQMVNVVLMNGEVVTGLQFVFDEMTNRMGKRAAQDIESSAAGSGYQIKKLTDIMIQGGWEAGRWAMQLIDASSNVKGQFGSNVRNLLEEFARSGEGEFSLKWQMRLKIVLEQEQIRQEAQEAGDKAAKLVEQQFGLRSRVLVTPEFAKLLPTLPVEEQTNFWQMSVRLANDALKGIHPPMMDTGGWFQYRDDALEVIKHLTGDADATFLANSKKWAKEEADANIAAQRARLEALSSSPTLKTDWEGRKKLAKDDLDLKKSILAQELADRMDELDRENAAGAAESTHISNLRFAKQETIRQLSLAAENAYASTIKAINLDELDAEYGKRKQILDLEAKLEEGTLDVAQRGIRERMKDEQELADLKKRVAREITLGNVSPETGQDLIRVRELQNAVAEQGRVEEARRRNAALRGLEQEAVLIEARGIVERSAGEDEYAAKRRLLDEQYSGDKKRIVSEDLHDAAKMRADLYNLYLEHIRDKKKLDYDELRWKRQLLAESFNQEAAFLSEVGKIVAARSGEARAKTIMDLAATASAVADTMKMIESMKGASTMGQVGGIFGIAGMALGLFSQIFGWGQQNQQRQVKELTDEFRHQEGRNVSPEFGRAQVINVHVQMDNSFRYWGLPARSEVRREAELLAGDMIDIMREEGVVGRG